MENYRRKNTYEEFHRKFRIWFPSVSVPLKSSMCENWRSFLTPTLSCGKLYFLYVYVCVYTHTHKHKQYAEV
jgi:hypothetical protein